MFCPDITQKGNANEKAHRYRIDPEFLWDARMAHLQGSCTGDLIWKGARDESSTVCEGR
jgi:hypothetical protein